MPMIVFTDYEPELGPPKPDECIDGWLSHDWHLSIEEGQPGLTTDCNLCNDGLQLSALLEDGIEMRGVIPVRLEIVSENQGDNSYAYMLVTPISSTNQGEPNEQESNQDR